MTQTTPSYNGGPVFKVGEEVRNLHFYGPGKDEPFGTITAILGPYEVEILATTGRTRRMPVGTIGHIGDQWAADEAMWKAARAAI